VNSNVYATLLLVFVLAELSVVSVLHDDDQTDVDGLAGLRSKVEALDAGSDECISWRLRVVD
jgi:hypothetical protein